MSEKIYINNGWQFSSQFSEDMMQPSYSGTFEEVRLPHTVAVTPYNNFDEHIYQKLSIYRKSFVTDPSWKGRKVLVTFEGAGHYSEVYINGKLCGSHKCGYTAFTVDLTPYLAEEGKENLLAVKLDSRESLDVPPFGFVIDYMTYGGLYRDVYLEVKNPVYIEDVFVTTSKNQFNSRIILNTEENLAGYTFNQRVVKAEGENQDVIPSSGDVASVNTGVSGVYTLTSAEASSARQWTLEDPALYYLVTDLVDGNGNVVDTKAVRFGFRDIRYDETGFYLNGKKIKIRGLNRHQAYPYVGYAVPKNMQRDDADVLKYKLGLNEVRTSHYPQSQYFVDRCDEIGLLVFTEIPGWQHIGGADWKNQGVENVRDMVIQYRNHPSIFLWGVRINESGDDDEFYTRTNAEAHELDPSRPTGGVRFLKQSNLLEDVYTYNDFSHIGTNAGIAPKKTVTNTKKGFMVTEYCGHMFPTKAFDCESHRTEHAIRHANVINDVAGSDEHSGASGWCAFDYNTHKDFGSGDRICYHGVMDMYRNPKLAAYVYQSQGEPEVVGDVLCATSSMDIGEYPGGSQGDVWVFTNADSVKLYVNDIFIKEYTKDSSPYKNLPHGPILMTDFIGHRLVDEEKVPEKYSEQVKALLQALRVHGVDKLPKKYFFMGVHLLIHGVTDEKRLRTLYGKYIGNWGGTSITYKFEAWRNGKLVKTVLKTPFTSVGVKAAADRTELVEANSYDMTEVHLFASDEHDNVQPYCQEAVTLRTEGCIELVGPEAVSLKGGMAGTYVRSTGKEGKGKLIIMDWMGNETDVNFNVSVQG